MTCAWPALLVSADVAEKVPSDPSLENLMTELGTGLPGASRRTAVTVAGEVEGMLSELRLTDRDAAPAVALFTPATEDGPEVEPMLAVMVMVRGVVSEPISSVAVSPPEELVTVSVTVMSPELGVTVTGTSATTTLALSTAVTVTVTAAGACVEMLLALSVTRRADACPVVPSPPQSSHVPALPPPPPQAASSATRVEYATHFKMRPITLTPIDPSQAVAPRAQRAADRSVTTLGVMKMSSSVRLLYRTRFLNRFPSTGMSPSTTVPPFSTRTWVLARLVLITGPAVVVSPRLSL